MASGDKMASCPYCGSTFYLDDEMRNPSVVNINIEHYNAAPVAQKASASEIPPLLAAVVALTVLAFLAVLAIPLFLHMNHMKPQSLYRYRTIPESEPIRQFAEAVFEKRPEEITAEEYASLQYLRPYKEAKEDSSTDTDTIPWSFSYAMQVDSTGNPVDARTLTVQCTEKSVLERDLQAFPGLVRIDLDGDGSFEWDTHSYEPNLKNLTALRYLNLPSGSSFRLSQVTAALSDPSALLGLQVAYLADAEDLEALSGFTGLKSLWISYMNSFADNDLSALSGLTQVEKLAICFDSNDAFDLAFLSSMTKLRELSLSDGGTLKSTSVLYGMPQLESLSLERIDAIKDLSFVSNMPQLHRLLLNSCPVLSLEPLRDNLTIYDLSLCDIDELKDLSPVASMTSLKSLQLYKLRADTLPSLSALSALSDAVIYPGYLPALRDMTQLKKLTIYEYNAADYSLEPLTTLSGLESLRFIDNTSEICDCDPARIIGSLPALRELSGVSSVLYYGSYLDNSPLFSSSSLKRIDFRSSDSFRSPMMILEPSRLPENTVLTELILDGCTISDLSSEDRFASHPLGEYADRLLPHMKGLEVLSLRNVQLKDLSFVSNLPELRSIDISDNYVTDLSPLLACPKLEQVTCGGNPVKNPDILPETITVSGS